ncbi:hypothetical protein [Metabacillus sp. SLBN-84]
MIFEIKDEQGFIHNKVTNPAAVFDKDSGTLHKIGEREEILDYFNAMNEAYRGAGFHDIADDLHYIELPKDQEEIDKVFQITGYIKVLYARLFAFAH